MIRTQMEMLILMIKNIHDGGVISGVLTYQFLTICKMIIIGRYSFLASVTTYKAKR